ncbi:MAG: choice-of-anchor D domain-containing protein, partial [Gemmatimonadetes bacterium]
MSNRVILTLFASLLLVIGFVSSALAVNVSIVGEQDESTIEASINQRFAINVKIDLEGASLTNGVGAFEFKVQYDADLLSIENTDVLLGTVAGGETSYLAAEGRIPTHGYEYDDDGEPATLDSLIAITVEGSSGELVFACATLPQEGNEADTTNGTKVDGYLAQLWFTALDTTATGDSSLVDLVADDLILVDPAANRLEEVEGVTITTTDGYVKVKGTRTIEIPLTSGWNLISFNVLPDDQSVEAVMANVLDDVMLITTPGDGFGRGFWRPNFPFSSLSFMDPSIGYWVQMSQANTLEITGAPVAPTSRTISLSSGWNLVSYLPETAYSVEEALASILSSVQLVTTPGDGFGRGFWRPNFPFSSLSEMAEGIGYWVQTDANVELTYPANSSGSRILAANSTPQLHRSERRVSVTKAVTVPTSSVLPASSKSLYASKDMKSVSVIERNFSEREGSVLREGERDLPPGWNAPVIQTAYALVTCANATINGDPIAVGDWVGAYKMEGDNIVFAGAYQIEFEGGFGFNIYGPPYESGEEILFKVYDTSAGVEYEGFALDSEGNVTTAIWQNLFEPPFETVDLEGFRNAAPAVHIDNESDGNDNLILDFGQIPLSGNGSVSFDISNTGDDGTLLTGTLATTTPPANADVLISPDAFTDIPTDGTTETITVTVDPTESAQDGESFSATITISSNGGDQNITLSGSFIANPVIPTPSVDEGYDLTVPYHGDPEITGLELENTFNQAVTYSITTASARAERIIGASKSAVDRTLNRTKSAITEPLQVTVQKDVQGNIRSVETEPVAVGNTRVKVDVTTTSQRIAMGNVSRGGDLREDNVTVTTNPTSGTIDAGAVENVTVTFDASTAPIGSYSGNITVTVDGFGDLVIPWNLTVEGAIVSITPVSNDFGEQEIGTTSPSAEFEIANTGNVAINFDAETGEHFTVGNGSRVISGTVEAGGTTSVFVSFTPGAEGALSGELNVTPSDAVIWTNGTDIISGLTADLTGTGISIGRLSVAETNVDFGDADIDDEMPQQAITVSNDGGTGTILITGLNFGGDNAADFMGPNPFEAFELAPDASETITLTFDPSALGERSATVMVNAEITGETDQIELPTTPVNLTGVGVKEDISANSLAIDFDRVRAGETAMQTVTLTNDGTDELIVNDIVIAGESFTRSDVRENAPSSTRRAGNGSSVMATRGESTKIATLRDDNFPYTVLPGGSLEFDVTFAPTDEATYNGTVTVTSSDPDESPLEVTLTGQGFLCPGFLLTGVDVDGSVTVGERVLVGMSGSNTITVTNFVTDPDVAGNLLVDVQLSDNEDGLFGYQVDWGESGIAPNASGTITVTYTPTAYGMSNATLNISILGAGECGLTDPDPITLIGSGVAAEAVVKVLDNNMAELASYDNIGDLTAIDFGIVPFGSSAMRTLRFMNTDGDANTYISTLSMMVSLTDDDGEFSMSDTTGISMIGAGESFDVTITFAPDSTGGALPGIRDAQFDGTTNDPDEPTISVAITGDGQYR